ncbi:hypothetical protein [Lederbergia citri]|uniref:Uncharacterized protein n=1 Tax=Lederbergia citri TaxID=2833580 RepID=A0A942YHW4_9BACI|nr:hypothetical protein [Lederbergia citri]MBS4197703.1 hypothetical protein [Lederbergia citri]
MEWIVLLIGGLGILFVAAMFKDLFLKMDVTENVKDHTSHIAYFSGAGDTIEKTQVKESESEVLERWQEDEINRINEETVVRDQLENDRLFQDDQHRKLQEVGEQHSLRKHSCLKIFQIDSTHIRMLERI